MSGVLFYLPNARQLSLSGAIQAGWKAQFYLTGTTTPTPVYSDGALETELPNPVVADGSGVMPPVYLNPAVTYRVQILTHADVLQQDVDPYTVQGGGGAAGAEPVEVTFSTTTNIDCSESDTFFGLLAGLVNTLNMNNPTNGQRLKLFVLVSGEVSLAFPANWIWVDDDAPESLVSDRLHEFDMTYLENPDSMSWPPGDYWYVKHSIFYGWPS